MSELHPTSAVRDCIVVTGASKGIGAAIAHALAEHGHHVVCMSRSGTPPAGGAPDSNWILECADVTRPDTVHAAFVRIAAAGWRIKGLVNNAGLHLNAPSASMDLSLWHQIMDTNATSVVSVSQAAYPHLVASEGGVIVNIGSFFDKLGVKRNLAYCASKAAVGAITRCLAVEWASKGIRVIDVAPGYIETDLNAELMGAGSPLLDYLAKRIPSGKHGKAADVAAFVAVLFSPASSFLSGETIYLDGGQSIAH